MKSILLACHHTHIDPPLRRSLAHLIKSCQIDIVHNGHQVFETLSLKTFDLFIIDFDIVGIDSLELVESIQYIDPDVPTILMVSREHTAIWQTAHQLKAHPIARPFKPLFFLRLVDRLLHQQLDRYRRLAQALTDTLSSLCAKTDAPCAFLVEEDGQILFATGGVEGISLDTLADLAISPYSSLESAPKVAKHEKTVFVYPQLEQAYGLYVVSVTEALRLVLALPTPAGNHHKIAVWSQLDLAARNAQLALQQQAGAEALTLDEPELTHQFIPFPLQPEPTPEPPVAESPASNGAEIDEIAVNWAIITRDSNALNRLHEFCRAR